MVQTAPADPGFPESPTPLIPVFDEQFYLRDNPDVAKAVSLGVLSSGNNHFIQFGEKEGRSGTFFDNALYLAAYPDVAGAVRAGTFSSGLGHWINFGRLEANRFAYLTGTSGNDVITGLGGGSTLTGLNFVDISSTNVRPTSFGVSEVDTLISGPGTDIFNLGLGPTLANSTAQALYVGNANADYALNSFLCPLGARRASTMPWIFRTSLAG